MSISSINPEPDPLEVADEHHYDGEEPLPLADPSVVPTTENASTATVPSSTEDPITPAGVEESTQQENPASTATTTTEPEVNPTESTPSIPVGVENPSQVVTPPGVPTPGSFLEQLMAQITPVTETRKTLKILVYGDYGTRKSSFLGSVPNNLIVDVEGGLASLNNTSTGQVLADGVQVLPYQGFDHLETTVQVLLARPPALDHVECLSVDSFSELHKRGLAETVEREWRKAPSLNNKFVAETEQHTENNEHIRRLLSDMRDLDRNIIITAHARTIEPKGQQARTFPDFSEKLANTLAGIVDVVAYSRLVEVEGEIVNVWQFQGTAGVAAKSRIGGLPPTMTNPTWNEIWDIFISNN